MTHLTRREALATGAAASALIAAPGAAAPAAAPDSASPWTLWYRQPAEQWVEALPVGNGRLGAMVHGGTGKERLQLNEDSLWGGGPYDPSRPEALAAFTGETRTDASAVADYFQPLNVWLTAQNKNEKCGW